MFNQLFPYPRVAERHQNGPLADARLCYLDHLAAQGAAPLTLRNTARELLVIAREMCWDGSGKVNLEQIAAAANHWATRPQHPLQHGRRTQNAEGARAFFMLIARRWIRFLGCLSESEEPVSPGYVHSADFAMYLRDERGLSPRTIQNRSWHVERLLGWIATRGLSLHQLSVMDIEEYLSQATATGWTRVSINTCAGALRSFLRHAENRRWCSSGLAAAICGPRIYRNEALPAGPTWPTVERLLATVEGDRPKDIRDRAILLFFVVYGFRAGEVSRLRLEDRLVAFSRRGGTELHSQRLTAQRWWVILCAVKDCQILSTTRFCSLCGRIPTNHLVKNTPRCGMVWDFSRYRRWVWVS